MKSGRIPIPDLVEVRSLEIPSKCQISKGCIFFRRRRSIARVYIFEQSLTNNSNSNIVGTGGTPFMKYLDKHLQETVPSND